MALGVKMDYQKTLNLPQTAFPMKANLREKEPLIQKEWEEKDIFHKVLADRKANVAKIGLHHMAQFRLDPGVKDPHEHIALVKLAVKGMQVLLVHPALDLDIDRFQDPIVHRHQMWCEGDLNGIPRE